MALFWADSFFSSSFWATDFWAGFGESGAVTDQGGGSGAEGATGFHPTKYKSDAKKIREAIQESIKRAALIEGSLKQNAQRIFEETARANRLRINRKIRNVFENEIQIYQQQVIPDDEDELLTILLFSATIH